MGKASIWKQSLGVAAGVLFGAGFGGALVFFLFDLLHLDGEAIAPMPVTERKERLRALLSGSGSPLHFSDHEIGRGRAFYDHACTLKVEGIVSKRVDAPYAPGNRGLWLKVKCLNREEFVVVGWTDPEGARPWLGALLLAYYDPDGRLVYAGRAGTGIDYAELEEPVAPSSATGYIQYATRHAAAARQPVWLAADLDRVHWVRPELVAEVKYLSWTEDNLLRQVVYEGLREDKPAAEVRRAVPYPKPPEPARPASRSRRPRSG